MSLRALFKSAAKALCVAALAVPLWAQATLVRVQTVRGPVDIVLFDGATPLTVANFLGYVRASAYDNSFFHRHAAGFVLQGGGYTFPPLVKIPAGPPVQNEFSATRSNLRGTVAMAKLGGNPNSATTEWFVNLANNAANLDTQNGGFTVFGRVTTPSMAVVDNITALPIVNAGSPFDNLPAINPPAVGSLTRDNLVVVSFARELQTAQASDSDRAFNYLEAQFPQFISPASPGSLTAAGYYFRYYAATNSYVGTKDGNIYYLVPAIDNDIHLLGPLADWLAVAISLGY